MRTNCIWMILAAIATLFLVLGCGAKKKETWITGANQQEILRRLGPPDRCGMVDDTILWHYYHQPLLLTRDSIIQRSSSGEYAYSQDEYERINFPGCVESWQWEMYRNKLTIEFNPEGIARSYRSR